MPTIDEELLWLNAAYIKDNNLALIRATVGDAQGNVPADLPGWVWVRVQTSNGLSAPRRVLPPAGKAMSLKAGSAVTLEYDKMGNLRIAEPDTQAQLSGGVNVIANVVQPDAIPRLTQGSIETLRVIPSSPASLIVAVKSWGPIIGNTQYFFAGAAVDLTSDVPSSGNMRYAVIFVKSDYATTEVFASTARSTADVPLDSADIQECITAASAGSTPVWAIKLIGGQTAITQDNIDVDGVDLRQMVNTTQGSGTVSGPASSTDRAIPTWNGTGGTTLRDNPNATIDSTGKMQALAYKLPASTELTEATDAITVTQGFHTVKAETGTTDNLATINGGSGVLFVTLQAKSGHTITVKNGTGNVFLNGGADYALSGDKTLLLFYDGTNWADVGIGGSGITGPGTSTDRAFATWNGTGGSALYNNTAMTSDSSGNATFNSTSVANASTTISSDAASIAAGFVVLTSETGTSDNLATLSTVPNGRFVSLQAASGHTITVKNGTGNIFLNGGADFVLSGDKTLLLFSDGTNWADVGAGGSGTDANAIHVNVGGEISGITAKTSPVNADLLVIEDSAASNAKKKITIGSLPPFVASGASHAVGIVPDPGASGGTTKFLREDSSWQVPPGTGATKALDNLASTAVNADILPATDNSKALGSATLHYSNIWSVNTLNDVNAIPVKNVSGSTANAGDLGILQYDSTNGYSYTTTTTANLFAQWCVVIVGAANNSTIYVATQGKVTVTLNANCSIGNFLLTSTTAGRASVSTTMRPEIFAVALTANSGGAGGTCVAQLLCNTVFIPAVSSNLLWGCYNHSASDFVSVINGAPTATSVTYGNISAGAANAIVPANAGDLGKMILWNTTRSTGRLITAVNTGTKVITTVSTTDSWASTDAITIESQTVVNAAAARFVDVDLSQQTTIPTLARNIWIMMQKLDSGGGNITQIAHPWETIASSKNKTLWYQTTNFWIDTLFPLPLINGRFAVAYGASGSGTALDEIYLQGYDLASA